MTRFYCPFFRSKPRGYQILVAGCCQNLVAKRRVIKRRRVVEKRKKFHLFQLLQPNHLSAVRQLPTALMKSFQNPKGRKVPSKVWMSNSLICFPNVPAMQQLHLMKSQRFQDLPQSDQPERPRRRTQHNVRTIQRNRITSVV